MPSLTFDFLLLPEELRILVLSFVDEPQDIACICRNSRGSFEVSNRFLWRRTRLSDAKAHLALERTLKEKPQLGTEIDEIRFEYADWGSTFKTDREMTSLDASESLSRIAETTCRVASLLYCFVPNGKGKANQHSAHVNTCEHTLPLQEVQTKVR